MAPFTVSRLVGKRISREHFSESMKLIFVALIILLLVVPVYGWETAPGYESVLDPVFTESTHGNSQQATRDGLRLSFKLGAAYGPATQGQDIAGFNALVDQWNAWVRANFGEDLTMLMQRMNAPAEPINMVSGNAGGSYLANSDTKVYHNPSCAWAQKILPVNRIWFSNPNEARSAGYRPCEKCNPP